MADDVADDLWFDVAFFIPKTPSRRAVLAKMVAALELPKAKKHPGASKHVLQHAFGEVKRGPYLVLHVDESTMPAKGKSPASTQYYVQLHVHNATGDHEHEHYPGKPGFGVDWVYEQLASLTKGVPPKWMFFDAEAEFPNWPVPTSLSALPLSLGGRVLPVVGVEYATNLADGVNRFRWTQTRDGIKVNLSYVATRPFTDLQNLWESERVTVTNYVKEALPR